MQQQYLDSEQRSDDVQELINLVPNKIFLWGILAMLFITITIASLAYFVRLPEFINTSFTLQGKSAPKTVVAHTSGKLVKLFIEDQHSVSAGQHIAYLESTSKHDDVLQLLSELKILQNSIKINKEMGLKHTSIHSYSSLGELQSSYQVFEQHNVELQKCLHGNIFSKRKSILRNELSDLKSIATELKLLRNLQEKDVQFSNKEIQVQRMLSVEKVIPTLELNREESKHINRQLAYQQASISIISNLMDQRMKQRELLDIDKQIDDEKNKFISALNNIISEIETWKKKYIITAPIDGTISFIGIIQENQEIPINQEVFYIIPSNSEYNGQLKIRQSDIGKIKIGQPVSIKFLAFPYQKYGVVQGVVTHISNIAFRDSVFYAKVSLPNGLKTNYNQSLMYKTGMIASASVTVANSTIMDRFIYKLPRPLAKP